MNPESQEKTFGVHFTCHVERSRDIFKRITQKYRSMFGQKKDTTLAQNAVFPCFWGVSFPKIADSGHDAGNVPNPGDVHNFSRPQHYSADRQTRWLKTAISEDVLV